MTFGGQMLILAASALFIGIFVFSNPDSIDWLLESPIYMVAFFVRYTVPQILGVVWLVSKVRSRQFLHAALYAAVHICIDTVFLFAYPGDELWLQLAYLLGKIALIMLTATVTIWVRDKPSAAVPA